MTEKKRFERSRTNRLVGGVLGGIAEYFGWNANLLRIIYVLVSIAIPFGHVILGLLVYVILMTFMPQAPIQSGGGNLSDLFRGATQPKPNDGRKVIHDVTEHDVSDSHKDGE
ncbi:PspC domain-containing protein [Levilactobacillus huananensis]|uniref:PspC domain-containing protein n=1 Tax=Levilactobacillus huananensis TaxID=2486019 RepID=UPI000F7B82F1|nr:PspC domain-containing protein [Levilactobacillus huananensis]